MIWIRTSTQRASTPSNATVATRYTTSFPVSPLDDSGGKRKSARQNES